MAFDSKINKVCFMKISAFWNMCYLIRYIGISVSQELDSSIIRVFYNYSSFQNMLNST